MSMRELTPCQARRSELRAPRSDFSPRAPFAAGPNFSEFYAPHGMTPFRRRYSDGNGLRQRGGMSGIGPELLARLLDQRGRALELYAREGCHSPAVVVH